MKITGLILIILAVSLLLDAFMAACFGKRYMLWGLEYTPAAYHALIERISILPAGILWGIRLAEMTSSFGLFWLGMKLI